MATNPFKAFIPFLINADYDYTDDAALRAVDPSGGQWRTVGLIEPLKGEGLMVDLNGSGNLMAVQFNERILPGKVRDEMLGNKVAEIERQNGRKVSKKEYAQLRDAVEFALLPKAFIRRTVVPVIITGRFALICTSSAKRADDCISILAPGINGVFSSVQTKASLPGQFRTLVFDEWGMDEDGMVAPFWATDYAVLKGEGKKVIRIKDKPLDEHDMRDLIKLAEYNVMELGIAYGDDQDEPELTFTVSASMIFKGIVTPGIKMGGKDYDGHAHATHCALEYRKMLNDFIEANGGLVVPEAPKDDEEEL